MRIVIATNQDAEGAQLAAIAGQRSYRLRCVIAEVRCRWHHIKWELRWHLPQAFRSSWDFRYHFPRAFKNAYRWATAGKSVGNHV